MNLNRSRTERWRECLKQIRDRRGTLEVSVDVAEDSERVPTNLVWRVHLLGFDGERIVVEQPMALGQTMRIEPGVRLVVAMAIGQNRWMFRSRAIEPTAGDLHAALHLSAPETVERCRRRDFYRASTAGFNLPGVQGWVLVDPGTAIAPEIASRLPFEAGSRDASAAGRDSTDGIMPVVGQGFVGKLLNIGGGGAGLLVEPGERPSFDSSGRYWLRIDLADHTPGPLAVTARCVHQHLDSLQNLHLGFSFDFAHHPEHRDFIVRQISAYVGAITDSSRHRKAG